MNKGVTGVNFCLYYMHYLEYTVCCKKANINSKKTANQLHPLEL